MNRISGNFIFFLNNDDFKIQINYYTMLQMLHFLYSHSTSIHFHLLVEYQML